MKQRVMYGLSAVAVALVLLLSLTAIGRTAITELSGLAVAQTGTTWKNVKDYLVGDNMTSGVISAGMVFYDATGANADRLRGSTANGILVDVTRAPGSNQTPADGFINPTTFQGTWSLPGVFNGTTWDRWRAGVSPTSSGTSLNSVSNSTANAVLTITLAGTAGQRIHLYKIAEAGCQVDGSSSYVVNDGATLVYATFAGQVPMIPMTFTKEWNPALTGTAGQAMTIVIQACGAGNTSTAQVFADKY
jgi:hypothetical protein